MDMEGNPFGLFLSDISLNSFDIEKEEEETRINTERTNERDFVRTRKIKLWEFI
jgi:hypothetical protein